MKTPRKITALVLMGALAASSAATAPASAQTFSDVPANHWASRVIDEISDQKVMVGWGDGIFAPESKLTRAEYTGVLYNLAPDKSNGDHQTNLSDVDPARWYAQAAEWAVSNGIISEINGEFRPDDPASRELMAQMTYMFIFWYYPAAIDFENIDAGYADQDQISSAYQTAVNVLTNNGLLAGRSNDMFEPQGTLTRAEAAAMASRILEVAAEQTTEDPSEDPEQPPVEDPDEEQPVDPGEDPSDEPENPPVDEPSDPDEDQPKWDMDGAPDWFLVGKPDSISQEVWDQLITYYADKECPEESNFPSKLPEKFADDEEAAKKYIAPRLGWLYDVMQKDLADQALAVDGYATLTEEEKSMVDMVNTARRAAGVPELKVSKALCEAADIRAEEASNYISHTRPNGSNAGSVLAEVGLGYFDIDGKINHVYYAENLTVGLGDSNYSASHAMEKLLASELHKDNLMTNTHEYLGIGFYSDGTNSAWIQIFARPQ